MRLNRLSSRAAQGRCAVRLIQRALDPLTVRFEGDHLMREPLEFRRAAGFEIDHLGRSKWGFIERVVARRP